MKRTLLTASCLSLVAATAIAAPNQQLNRNNNNLAQAHNTNATVNSKADTNAAAATANTANKGTNYYAGPLKSEAARLSYTIGADLGVNFKKQQVEINPAIIAQGIKDAQTGGKLRMSKAEMETTLKTFQKEIIAKRKAKFESVAKANKNKGEAFLAANKKKPGVVTLPSGLQYKVISKGTGAQPGPQDSVTVEYTGKLLNGKVFDSTKKTGQPATFKVSQVISGWSEALQHMKAGAKWDVFIPANLAYGQRGIGGPIGPNETLVFNIHLISVEKAKGKNAKPAAKKS